MNKYFIVILSSLFMGIAHHPLQLGFISWFSLVPLLFQLKRITNFKEIILVGVTWGFFYHLVVIFWLSMNIGTSDIIAVLSMFIAIIILTVNSIIIFESVSSEYP